MFQHQLATKSTVNILNDINLNDYTKLIKTVFTYFMINEYTIKIAMCIILKIFFVSLILEPGLIAISLLWLVILAVIQLIKMIETLHTGWYTYSLSRIMSQSAA